MEKREHRTREVRARRRLSSQGLTLQKSRVMIASAYDMGGYRIVDRDGRCLAGANSELRLEDVERFIADRAGA